MFSLKKVICENVVLYGSKSKESSVISLLLRVSGLKIVNKLVISTLLEKIIRTMTSHITIGSREESSVSSFKFHFNDLPRYEDTSE